MVTGDSPPALVPGEVCLWLADIRAGNPASLAAVLSEEELARAWKFHSGEDALRYVVARCMLRTVLSEYLGREPCNLAFEAGPGGKPRLPGEPPAGLRFNVSHSGDMAIVAVAGGREVGIDAELICDPVPEPGAIRHYCSQCELAGIDALRGRDQAAAYYRIWTRKEALLKATGEGLGGLSPGLDVCSGDLQVRHGKTWHLYDLDLRPGYAVAIAVESPVSRIGMKAWRDGNTCGDRDHGRYGPVGYGRFPR